MNKNNQYLIHDNDNDISSELYIPLDNVSIKSRLWERTSSIIPEISENTRLSTYEDSNEQVSNNDFDSIYTSDSESPIEYNTILEMYKNENSESLIVDKYKILLNVLNELEKEVTNPNLKIKMKNLSDDLLDELDKTPYAKKNIKSYFKTFLKKLSPKKKEIIVSEPYSKKTIPIKPLKDISEKFVNKSLIDDRDDAIFNISKSYYHNLKNLSEKYYQDLKETNDPKQIEQIKKNYNKESLETVKSLRKNIISQFGNKNQNALSNIYKVFEKKIQNILVEKNNQLDKEENVSRQLEIRDYFNNQINELKDISEFYKGLSQK
jgi:hypothetical protein